MRTYLTTVLATLLIGLPAISPAADNADALRQHPEVAGALAAIDAWVEGNQIYGRIPGISAGIVVDQDMLWSRGYGHSNLENGRAADEDTLYSICSISKLFTAVSIMQLRDEGLLRLDDDIDKHLDWFDLRQAYDDSGPVTIESLLTHSSGLPRESDFPYWNGPEFPFPTREQMIDRLATQETLYPAQRYFQYSNLALSLAGEIVQAVSGQDYEEYVADHILEPLGLTDTRTHFPDQLHGEQLAIGYTGLHREQTRTPVEPFYTRGITAAAGFTSSVKDLAAFASWQFRLLAEGDDEVLAANTLREMHRVHWVDPDWQTTWGIGFEVRQSGDLTIVSHGGGCPGYITSFSMAPKHRLAAIVLTNAGDGPARGMAVDILKTLAPALKKAETPVTDELPDLSRYEGNFEMRPWGGEVAVRQWGEYLVAIDLPGDDLNEAMTKLTFDGEDTFTRLTDDDDRREPWRFEFDAEGRVSRIVRHSSVMTRVE